jgi:hypothetical protein
MVAVGLSYWSKLSLERKRQIIKLPWFLPDLTPAHWQATRKYRESWDSFRRGIATFFAVWMKDRSNQRATLNLLTITGNS